MVSGWWLVEDSDIDKGGSKEWWSFKAILID